jgi:hypothetical protein
MTRILVGNNDDTLSTASSKSCLVETQSSGSFSGGKMHDIYRVSSRPTSTSL